MLDITIRSLLEVEIKIKDSLNNLKPDLDIVSNGGAIVRTNKLLVSQFSPILRSILDTDKPSSPSVLHLPDVTAQALIHLINIIKNGFTAGPGSGYSVIKEVREVAQVLGFENIPVLTFVVQRQSQPQEDEDLAQDVPAGSHGSEIRMGNQVSVGAEGVDRMEIENEYENASNTVNMNKDYVPGVSCDNNASMERNKASLEINHASKEINDSSMEINKASMEINNRHGISYNEESPKTSGSGLCTFEPLKVNTSRTKVRVPRSSKNTLKFKNKVDDQISKRKVSSSSKRSSNILNKNVEVQVREHKNREVTQAIKKVLKIEPNEEPNDDNDLSNVWTKIPCGVCRKSYGNAGTLLVHAEQHGENKTRRNCTLCSFSGTRTTLLSHMRSFHTKEKLFECPVCQKRFSTCKAKDQHEKKHK